MLFSCNGNTAICIMERKFKQWWTTFPPMSTKRKSILSPHNHLNTKKRTTPNVGNPDTGLRQTQQRSQAKVRVTRSLVLCVCFVDRCMSFCTFSFGYFVICSS